MLIFLLDVDTGTETQMTTPPSEDDCTGKNGDYWPAWSPDGQQLAFGRKFGDTEHLAVLNVADRQLEEWVPGPAAAGHPKWSPDGRYLLFEEDVSDVSKTLQRLDLKTHVVTPISQDTAGSLADWR
jgi:Tol biopolymer transport system component